MESKAELVWAIVAFSLYVIGGLSTFGGFAMVVFMKGRDLYGLGDAGSIGYLLLCVGLCLSIFGVLIIRIIRNRFPA